MQRTLKQGFSIFGKIHPSGMDKGTNAKVDMVWSGPSGMDQGAKTLNPIL